MKRLNVGKSLIVKARKNEARKACIELFDFLDIKNKIGSADKIIVKPNIVSMQHYTIGSITDPLIVWELVKYVREFSKKQILIAESETIWKTRKRMEMNEPDYDEKEQKAGFELSLESSGIKNIIEKSKNVKALNITRAKKLEPKYVEEKTRKKFGKKSENIFPEFYNTLPEEFDADALYIGLSKLKSHFFHDTKVTNCMKNQFGLISHPDKTVYHYQLSEVIRQMNMIVQSFFDSCYITEALRYTMEGGGPTRGDTVKNLGLAAAGNDAVEVDAIAAALMMVNPSKLDYLELSKGLLGDYSEKELRKIPKSMKYKFKLHPDVNRKTREDYVYQ